MKKFKIRLNCTGFTDVVVEAADKESAKFEAQRVASNCNNGEWEFCEFLKVEKDEEIEN
jgi:hypothetical protein